MKRLASYSMRQLRGETFWSNCAQNAHTAACKTNSFGKKDRERAHGQVQGGNALF